MARGLSEADPILYALGGKGRYQLQQFFLVEFGIFSTAFQLLNFVFVGRSIPHTCTAPDNLTDIFNHINDDRFSLNTSSVEFNKCNIRVTSNISGIPETASLDCIYGYTYAERKDLSVISDMDVVCDRAALKGLGQTLLILGQGIGALSLPVFSDKYGRRPVLLVSHIIFLGLGLGVAFAPSYLVFLILRILLGIVQQGMVLSMQTYATEIFPSKYRRMGGLLGSFIWSTVCMMIALVGFLGRFLSWRYLQLAYCSVSLFVFVQYFFLDESLRWLTANGADKKIVRNLKKAARTNRKKAEDILQVYERLKAEAAKEEEQEQEQDALLDTDEIQKEDDKQCVEKPKAKGSFLDLMKKGRLALNVAVLWFIWMTDSMTFFGMFLTAHTLAGSRFVNFFLFSMVEAPSAVVYYFMLDRFGRRWTSMTLHAIAGIALIAATVVRTLGGGNHSFETAVTVLSCIGVFGINGAWGVSFFFTPEMFPTNLRNFGLGTCSSFSRIGGMLAPFASLLAEYVPWAPGAIFGACCMLVSVLVHILPETRGRELPQTLHDLESWYRKDGKESKMADKNGLTQRKLVRAA